MADRLISADALIAFMKKGWRVFPSSELRHTCDITDIENAPTIDAEPVVRCKDCKYLNIINKAPVYACCSKHNHTFYLWEEDTREHFCSWAERREDDANR